MDRAFLANIPLFVSFSPQEQEALSENFILREFHRGDFLFKQGTPAQAMFLIQSGQVTLHDYQTPRQQEPVTCGPQTLLGEVDLLLNRPYQKTAIVEGVVEAWILTRPAMLSMTRAWPEITPKLSLALGEPVALTDRAERETIPHTFSDELDQLSLSGFPLFANLSLKQQAEVAEQAELKSCSANEIIFRRGTQPNHFYLLVRGQVKLFNEYGHIDVVRQGGFFGEISLLTGQPYQMTAQTRQESDVLLFTREQFETIIKQYPAISFVLNRTLSARLLRANARLKPIVPTKMDQVQDIQHRDEHQNQHQHEHQHEHQSSPSSTSKFWSRIKIALVVIPLMWLAGIVAPSFLLDNATNPDPIEPTKPLPIEITPTPSPTPNTSSKSYYDS